MKLDELLKEIMKLPKAETINPISTMNSINIDDLMSAVDRLNNIPSNKKQAKQWNTRDKFTLPSYLERKEEDNGFKSICKHL